MKKSYILLTIYRYLCLCFEIFKDLNKPVCCTGCSCRPLLMQLHNEAKFTHSDKSPELLNQFCNFDIL